MSTTTAVTTRSDVTPDTYVGRMSSTTAAATSTDVSARELGELLAAVKRIERLTARAVVLAGALAGSGGSEKVDGLPLDLLLGLEARLISSDRRMLVTAGEVLAHMPTLAGLFQDGRVSWG